MKLLSVVGLVKDFGGVRATDGVDLDLHGGEVHALIGPNGAGKTTLIAQLAGELAPSQGRIVFSGKDVTALSVEARALRGIARSYQITAVLPDLTCLENVILSVQARGGSGFRFWTPAMDDEANVNAAMQALEAVGLTAQANLRADSLAHGARRQLELAMTLALQPRLLLLDEPLAGMSQAESEAMVALLLRLKGSVTMLIVEHDLKAIFALADRITVLVYGRPIASGTPEQIRADAAVHTAYLGTEELAA